MNKSQTMVLALVLSALASGPVSASAQAFEVNGHAPTHSADDGFTVGGAQVLPHLRPGVRLDLDYAHDPLIIEQRLGETDTEVSSIVEHQLSAHLHGSIGLFGRLEIFAGLQFNILQSGDDYPGYLSADGTGMGDLWLGARVRLYGERDDTVAVALQAAGTIPLASLAQDASLSGETGWHFWPRLLVEARPGPVKLRFDVGANLREESVPLRNLIVGHELTFGVGLEVAIYQRALRLLGEIHGRTSFSEFFSREETPVEWVLGLKYHTPTGFNVGVGGGAGLVRGFSAPDLRVFAMVGLGAPDPEPEPEIGDRDGDGFLDDVDACPDDPEDFDDFEDDDGCPELDNDLDGIEDGSDACPNDPEDRDGFEDEDGCPDNDNDQDGILDSADACPNDPEDIDGFEDEDGCPEADNDQDGILDVDDDCPEVPGVPEHHGCPEPEEGQLIEVRENQIVTFEHIAFPYGRSRILHRSFPTLRQIAELLNNTPEYAHVVIEGHTDHEGSDEFNMDLSQRRARQVVLWLVRRGGVDASRFVATGCGENLQMLEGGETRAANQPNRRVEIRLLENFTRAVRAGCNAIAQDGTREN